MCNVSACNTPVSLQKLAGVLSTPVFAGPLPKLLPWHWDVHMQSREELGEGNLGFKETMLNQKYDQKKVEGKEMNA